MTDIAGHSAYPTVSREAWTGLQIIARGANRLCARDPDQPQWVLKFELAPALRTPVGPRARLRRWLARKLPHLGENQTELRAYRKLHARLGSQLTGILAHCDGIQHTRWGEALRLECIFSGDGSVARSLFSHLFEKVHPSAEHLCTAVDQLERWLLQHHVPLFDLNAGNLVVVEDERGVHLVCVDAKSTLSGKELIPFSRWFKPLMRRKIQRRAHRLRQRIRGALCAAPPLAESTPRH